MRFVINSQDDYEIVPMSTIQQHTRVDDGYDRELLEAYRDAATELAAKQTNRMLVPTNVTIYVPNYKAWIALPFGQVGDITKVEALNGEGTKVEVEYTYNAIGERITFGSGLTDHTDFEITYDCGYPQGDVPNPIVNGILMLVGTFYNVREDISYGVSGYEMPITSKRLFNLFRIPAFE